MFKSKVFLKAMFIVAGVIVAYSLAIFLFVTPKIDKTIYSLEEKNAKEVLNKVVTITENVSKNLDYFRVSMLKRHKNELKNLTDTVWSIIQTKYEQSKPENLHKVLKNRGEMFKKNLTNFYNANKDKMNDAQMKKAIINYTKIYRHNSLNTGYFWINDFKANMIMHPINQRLDGKNLWNYKDPNGIYLFRNFTNVCKKYNSGIVKYQWINPNSKKIEDKISYVFTFKPFGWIFGTGEYYSVLKDKFQKEVISLVSKLRYGENNYFFISDYNNVLLSHPYLKGKDFSNIKDKKGNLIVPPMVKIARKKGYGYTSYWWKKNNKDNTIYQKLTFSKDFPNWKMVLGTGIYIDDINKEILKRKKKLMERLQDIVKTTKIGKNGYLYIFNGKAKMLIHPNSNINGTNFAKLKNPTNDSYIFDDLLKASKTTHELHYKWDKPTDKGNYIYDKISWIKYIPKLDWYVVSSAYTDDFRSSSRDVKNYIFWISFIIFIVSLLYSFFFLKNLLKPISKLSELALMVSNGNYKVRSDIKGDDEIGVLAKEFNSMVDTIEDNIKNLDTKIKDSIKELEEQKEYISAIMNAQSNIVITTDGKTIRTANQAFLDFYDIKNLEQFRDKYGSCICDTFQEGYDGYITKDYKGERWIDYVLNRPNETHKTIILQSDQTYTFSIVSHSFIFEDESFATTVFTDITEMEKIKNELQHQQRYSNAIMNSQSNMLVTNDGKKLRTANKRLYEFYNINTIDEFVKTYGECICETFATGYEGYLTKVYKGEKWIDYILSRPNEVHKAIIFRDEVKYIFSVSAHSFHFEDEVLITIVFSDITEAEHIKNELEIAKNRAEESVRLKSVFLANMSHEIRTPMNGIIGMAYLALQTNSKEKQKHYIHEIDTNAKSLLGIINDILDFSKIEAGKLTIEKVDFNLFDAINNVVNMLKLRAHENNIEIIVDYDINVTKDFFGDSIRINQILTNLLTNAIKFTNKGEVKIAVKTLQNNMMRFEVIDTGIGLTKEQQGKLFQSFSQADGSITRKYGGTGLGLAISKQLVELMNGKIWVESQIDIGSSFIFEIELVKKGNNKQLFTIFSDKKVLVVEDNQSWRDVFKYLLESFGIEVKCAEDGASALALIKEMPTYYDLILMDWNMSNLDGIETAKIIHNEIDKNLKIVLISAFKDENLVELAQMEGIDKFLDKPIDPSILNDTLSDIFLGTSKTELAKLNSNENSLRDKIQTLRGSKILLTEDNKANQEIILGLLENSGIIIDIANNGVEAVQKAKENSYEVIFMDLQMPIMDGYEATKLIRKDDKEIPIIALTANAMIEDVEKTKQAGMNKHLNKPIEVEKLYKTLLEFISKKTDEIMKRKVDDDINLPDFEHLDKNSALKLVLGNKKIYLNILKGLLDYKYIKLENMDDEEFKRTIHTIKGISASAGATALNEISKRLDETQDKLLLEEFYDRLFEVTNELELKISENDDTLEKIELSSDEKEKLFLELKDAISTKRAKNTKPIIEKLDKYKLSQNDNEKFQEIKALVKKFKFKQAMEIL